MRSSNDAIAGIIPVRVGPNTCMVLSFRNTRPIAVMAFIAPWNNDGAQMEPVVSIRKAHHAESAIQEIHIASIPVRG